MISILGILFVFAAVLGGFVMEKGSVSLLIQPAEIVIIFGAAFGTLIAASPIHVLKKILTNLRQMLRGPKYNRRRYLETLNMMFHLFNKARKRGLASVENDIEDPEKSPLLSRYPSFVKDIEARRFVCDTMRMALTGGSSAFDVNQMMELDIDVLNTEALRPATALATMADTLPGMGIVAAVLGLVLSMTALGGPPEEIGKKVAGALMGTFLGILLCYGVVGPLAASMLNRVDDEQAYYHVLRAVMLSFIKGLAPIMAVEMARRAVPACVRPTFGELEASCRRRDPVIDRAVMAA